MPSSLPTLAFCAAVAVAGAPLLVGGTLQDIRTDDPAWGSALAGAPEAGRQLAQLRPDLGRP